MSARRTSSAVEPSHRSIVPSIPGVPWWAAVLIAVTATAVGYAFDAGHKELTHVFIGFYVAGCVAAVLAVRQSGLFTAVIQPPLILFFAVPGAYWLFHGGKIGKFKDLLINCGYPLIERFPHMLGTAGGVLLIGLIRWYFGMTQRTTTAGKADDATTTTARRKSAISGLAAKLSGWLSPGDSTEEAPDPGSQPAHATGRTSRSGRTARSSRTTARRTDRTRSRHARSAAGDDQPDPAAERPRRRPAPARDYRDYDAADPPPRSRRRPRPQDDPDLRAQPPRETRRDPHTRRNPYERPAPRSSRFDPYSAYEPAEPAEPSNRYERRGTRYEPYEPPRRRSAPGGPTGANPTHHPISQVRYRGSAPYDELRDKPRDEPPPERRNRSRTPRRPQPDREYDA
ncbi:MAG: hypothetical protein K2X56_06530 [Mycobacterium pseudokansasii]|uniref:DUF6542 domain-containing protein n=1 Tax=Mycobacterium TaxID=1763 RepID=UPI001604BF36|nr:MULTISPECIES: DUF6542 domain-containing protein [Mycobacterium]MBY0387754.1 hypothetical protein [Mycobacterium pseudokansasii]